MIVNELFYSLQGEGSLAGVPSVFIRLAGCPLRCKWCDTKYAWDFAAGTEMSPDQLMQQIKDHPTRYVVLTGGEPLLSADLAPLTCLLHQHGCHVTVETSGIKCPTDLMADLVSISPKLANSAPLDGDTAKQHGLARFDPASLQCLIETYPYQLKFVVDVPADLDEIAECLGQLPEVDPYKVYLMPQAVRLEEYLQKSRWLADFCLQTGFSFSPRLQVMLWDNQRGK
ncbi:MAG: 7-carboxy-7-deazaguanine synthase QueE [Planctomycetaceae bacterium]|nr:7-carboxy-7-deazaguanine synthase QueE [Planctomycetaceae bacterium]